MLTIIGWVTTLYTWKQNRQRQQKAWQWWYQQQTLQSHQTAESIRDGLLQQTFGFRRYLEGQSPNSQTPNAKSATSEYTGQWLRRFQSFHHSLETLSDELSPPFVADSLPHAIQFMIKGGQQPNELPPIELSLPTNWYRTQSTPQQNQTVLSILNTLLSLLLPIGRGVTQIEVNLSQQNTVNTLILKIKYSGQSSIQNQSELEYLKEIFHSLTAGQLKITRETLLTTSCLSWQNDKP